MRQRKVRKLYHAFVFVAPIYFLHCSQLLRPKARGSGNQFVEKLFGKKKPTYLHGETDQCRRVKWFAMQPVASLDFNPQNSCCAKILLKLESCKVYALHNFSCPFHYFKLIPMHVYRNGKLFIWGGRLYITLK